MGLRRVKRNMTHPKTGTKYEQTFYVSDENSSGMEDIPTAAEFTPPDPDTLLETENSDPLTEAVEDYLEQYEVLQDLSPKPQAQDQAPSGPKKGKHCPGCGRFVGEGAPHSCLKLRVARAAPFLEAGLMAGLTAGAIAFGPALFSLAAGALGTTAAVGWLGLYALRFGARRLAIRHFRKEKVEELHEHLFFEKPEIRADQKYVNDLGPKMGVQGEVTVRLLTKEQSGLLGGATDFANAGAISNPNGDNKTIVVGDAFLELPEAHRQAILAHEMAHLQRQNNVLHRFRAVSAPLAYAAGGAAFFFGGAGALVAGATVGAVWFGANLISNALHRREERRADREAYKVHGEKFVEAISDVSSSSPGLVRHDLPWRVEDVLCTHGNLPNRISDMRASRT